MENIEGGRSMQVAGTRNTFNNQDLNPRQTAWYYRRGKIVHNKSISIPQQLVMSYPHPHPHPRLIIIIIIVVVVVVVIVVVISINIC